MLTWKVDIFQGTEKLISQGSRVDAIGVTTNGIVKNNGENVMGGGIALEFALRWPDFPRLLGTTIKQRGNHTAVIRTDWAGEPARLVNLFAFPTKDHFRDPSTPQLVERSAHELVAIANTLGWEGVLLPCPGCGLGGLDWTTQVKPLIEPIFDNRFVITFKP